MTKLVFILLSSLSFIASAEDFTECWYVPKDKDAEVHEPHCFTLNTAAGDTLVSKKVTDSLAYDADKLASIRTGDGFLWLNNEGRGKQVLTYDNGPDYFAEDLARTLQNGKVGYFDRSLKMVVSPQYDFGFPFNGGLAIVCNGCIEQSDGEHKMLVGGKWGAIDRHGVVVHAIRYASDEIRRLVKD